MQLHTAFGSAVRGELRDHAGGVGVSFGQLVFDDLAVPRLDDSAAASGGSAGKGWPRSSCAATFSGGCDAFCAAYGVQLPVCGRAAQ